MDAENPVVKLCVEGMTAEGEGRMAEARALFRKAWDARSDEYEACVAAHYRQIACEWRPAHAAPPRRNADSSSV